MATKHQAKRRTTFLAFTAGFVLLAVIFGFTLGKPWLRQRVVDFRLTEHTTFIEQQASLHGLPAAYIRAIISAESGGDPNATSHKNARGLMQITEAAEKDVLRIHQMNKGNLYDPQYNIRIGTAYLGILADRFDGDLTLTTAAYHQGAARTRKMMDEYPTLSSSDLIEMHANRTTAAYVRRVMRSMKAPDKPSQVQRRSEKSQ